MSHVPNVSYFKSFECDAYCLNRLSTKGKFHSRAKKSILLGYSDTSKAYRIWLLVEKEVEITRDVKFIEKQVPKPESTSTNFTPEDFDEERQDRVDEQTEIDFRLIENQENHRGVNPEEAEDGRQNDEQDDEITDEPGPRTHGRGWPRILRTGQCG